MNINNMTFKSFVPMAALCLLASCSNSAKQEKAEGSSVDSVQTSVMSFQDCDLTLWYSLHQDA